MNFKNNKPMIINIGTTIFLVANLGYDFLKNNNVNYFRILLLIITLWIMYFIYRKTFLRKCRSSFYLIYIFIIAAMYFGSVLGFYTVVPNYDKILHLISGIIIAIIGYILFLYLSNGEEAKYLNPYLGIIFSILFSISGATIWEIWEFTTDKLFGLLSQNNSLVDSMMDIICGSLMGIVGNIPIYFHIKGIKIKFIEIIIEDMK